MSKIAEIIHWNSIKTDGFPHAGENVLAWVKCEDGFTLALDLFFDGTQWFRAGAGQMFRLKSDISVTHWTRLNGPTPIKARARG